MSQRLNGEDETAPSSEMAQKSFPDDPIMAHYGRMLELGSLASRYFTLADAASVVNGWLDAITAAERGEISVSADKLQNWTDHFRFSRQFLVFLRLYNGLDEEGKPNRDGFMGVKGP